MSAPESVQHRYLVGKMYDKLRDAISSGSWLLTAITSTFHVGQLVTIHKVDDDNDPTDHYFSFRPTQGSYFPSPGIAATELGLTPEDVCYEEAEGLNGQCVAWAMTQTE